MELPPTVTAKDSGSEPSAQTGGAHAAGHVALDLAADVLGLGVRVAAAKVGDHAFELELVGAAASGGVGVLHDQRLAGRAVEQNVHDGWVQPIDRRVGAEPVLTGQGLDDVPSERGLAGVGLDPGDDGALADGEGAVGNDEGGVKLKLGAQAVAVRAGAVGRVEGEDAGFEVGQADVAVLAGQPLAEGHFVAVDDLNGDEAFAQLEGGFQRVGQPHARVGLGGEAVNHDVDVVPEVAVEGWRVVDGHDLAVHTHTYEPGAPGVVEHALVLALAVDDHGRQHQETGGVVPIQDQVDHFLDGLGRERLAAGVAVGLPDARPEKAHVVVDLGDGAHGGARIVGGGFLVDGDGWRQALDLVDVRLLELAQELPGVGRQRLDVAPLALGVEGVEGETGLAGAGDTREDHELVARNLKVDVLEIVFPRAADDDGVVGHNVPA